ncbi:hypothetical protein HNP89_001514 [Methanococcus maripaludis]|uniref:Uncharacterized protein n=1 Tax=Methanococcus maripaludis TaxID=39152 RepID=A0A7J9P0R4_METMI|nr:hypothetical protein [Methanococcus maripaludis]MBA2853538.1 hypothetical protein [Methanococcus maripaludis]
MNKNGFVFENIGFDNISSKNSTISSEILRYFSIYCKAKEKGMEQLGPKEYMELVLSTVFLLKFLKEDIGEINLNDNQKNSLIVFQRYVYREYTGEYSENYLKYSLWRKDNVLRYSIDKYDIYLNDLKSDWKRIFTILVPNYENLKNVAAIILRTANKIGVLE